MKNHIARVSGTHLEAVKPVTSTEGIDLSPPAIDVIRSLFRLSSFERYVLMLCAGVELDAEVARLCADAQGNPNCSYPTFGLGLAALPEPHWSALSPASPLRRFRLIELCGNPVMAVTSSPLRIEERVLHYLTGVSYLEERLQGMLRPVREDTFLVDSHKRLVEKILFVWKNDKEKLPHVQLLGNDETSKLIIARRACAEIGLSLWYLPAELMLR